MAAALALAAALAAASNMTQKYGLQVACFTSKMVIHQQK